MITSFIHALGIFALVMAILCIIRFILMTSWVFIESKGKLNLSWKEQAILFSSISYIITYFIV